MLRFSDKDEFFEWIPVNKDDLLVYSGVSDDEFFERYLLDGIAQLDKDDISDLMEELMELQFDNCSKTYNYK
jgi:hypothetical protein